LAVLGAAIGAGGRWPPVATAAAETPLVALLQPPAAWSAAERTAIAAALTRLPPALRVRGPTAIVRDARGCDAEGWPDDSALVDAAGRIHLCGPGVGAGATASPEASARQVALAWLVAFDRVAGWSADPAWLRLNGWRTSLTAGWSLRPANDDPAGFAAPRGRRSPRWDLATFMATWLLDSDGHDGGIGCRLISQARFVGGRLGNEAPPGTRCEAFERWASLDRLDRVEVVLAAPSTAMVGSLFGHLLLRLAYRDDEGRTPLHLSRTIAFLADNDVPFDADPTYALKGIAGSYQASLHERDFLDSYREYVVLEGRDLRRWRLNLTETQRRTLLERIWTVAQGAHYAYYFFRQNCATLMVDLVDSVLPPARDAGVTGWLASPPASTLEPWQRESGADGRPLLEFVGEPILSFDHQARLTSRHRLSLEARMGAGLARPEAATLISALQDAHDPGAEIRSSAYARLATLLGDPRAGAPGDIYAWLRDATAIESYLSTLANEQAEAQEEHQRRARVRIAVDALSAELQREAVALGATSGEEGQATQLAAAIRNVDAPMPAARLAGYRALSELAPGLPTPQLTARVRRLALLVSEARYDVGRMKEVSGLRDALLFVDVDKPIDEQPYLVGFEDLVRAPVETRIAPPLRSLQRAKQALFASRALDASLATDEPEQVAATARREYDASLPRSGIDQFALLGGVVGGAGVAAAAGLVLDGALYDERLGDHRRFGFPSDTALVVARSSALFTIAGRTPAVAAYEMRAFGYRSLRLPLPEAGGTRRPIGWELYADVGGSRARALDAQVKVGWGLLAQLVERNDLRDHLLVGLSVAYDGYFPSAAATSAGRPQALAAPLSLELRAGLGPEPRYRSWLAARAWAQPIVPFSGASLSPREELGLQVEAHLALPTIRAHTAHDPALLFRAQLRRTTLTFTGAGAITEALCELGIELR
jgi:hypothetical protein